MADIDVAYVIAQLRQHLPCVRPMPVGKLRVLHRSRDYEGMVRLIRSAMNIEVRLLVGWVNSGGPEGMAKAPAWIEMPAKMPFFGSSEFKMLSIRMFLRKEFLEANTYDKIAIAIAHELSHLVLDSIHHPLRKEEKAVDLTAMLLGFSRLYMSAAHTSKGTLGYLTSSELSAAVRILVPTRFRIMRALSVFVRNFPRLVIAIVLAISIWASDTINSKIELHKALQAEAAELLIPKTINSYLTLVGAQVGIFSLTKTFLVTRPTQLDLAVREPKMRDAACAKHGGRIGMGATYAYEYRDQFGSLVGRFEVSSCPSLRELPGSR